MMTVTPMPKPENDSDDGCVSLNVPFGLHALLRFPLRERGEIITAVMNAYAAEKPTADQRVLRLLFAEVSAP